MKLTPDDLQRLHTKQVANVIRKLQSGKTLTAREETILAKARAADAAGEAQASEDATTTTSAFAKTWDDLAEACHVDRRTLTNVRTKFAADPGLPKCRADGRKEIAAWVAFLDAKGVRGRGVNNLNADFIDERQLRLKREHFQLEKAIYELRCAKEETVPLAHVEAALGATLSRFRNALDSLPGRIAGGIDEADMAELLAVLSRAEKQKLSYKKLRGMIEKGKVRPFADVHARREFVRSEIDQVQATLARCEYIEADPEADEQED